MHPAGPGFAARLPVLTERATAKSTVLLTDGVLVAVFVILSEVQSHTFGLL